MSVVELGVEATGGFDVTFFATSVAYGGSPGIGLNEPYLKVDDEVASVFISLINEPALLPEDTAVRIELEIGDQSEEFIDSYDDIIPQEDGPFYLNSCQISNLTMTAKAVYPRRLATSITAVGRKDYLGAIWGPRPRISPPGDDTDVRGYISADIGWYYYGGETGGDNNYVEATISFDWETLPGYVPKSGSYSKTLRLYGDETNAGIGFIQSPNAECRGVQRYADAPAEGQLRVSSGNGAPRAAYAEKDIKNGAGQTVGSCYVWNNEIGINADWGCELGGMQWSRIEGPRSHTFWADCFNAAGKSHARGAFKVIPYDGPAQSALEAWDVNHFCPFNDNDFSNGESVAFDAPGSINRWSERYSGSVYARIDGVSSTVFTFDKNTVGSTPEPWGFVFQPSSLEDKKFLGDAFRFPILLPGAAPSWTAARVHYNAAYTLHGFDAGVEGWTASAGSVSASGGALMMEGAANPKIASVNWQNKLQNNYRYLRIRLKTDDAGVAIRAKVGSKTWEYTSRTTYMDWDIDLCAPANLSGNNQDLSRAERLWSGGAASASQGGWAWGLEVEKDMDALTYADVAFTLEADTSNKVYIDSIIGLEKGVTSGYAVVGEQVEEDPRFRAKDDGATETYLKRMLSLVRNGHVVEELWCGSTWTDPASATGQKEAKTVETIASMFSAYGFSNDANAVTRLQPAASGSGPFDNSAPAYMLYPGYFSIYDGLEIKAWYAADRVRLWDGATAFTLKAVRVIGGGIAGILAHGDGAIPSEVVDIKLSGALRDHDVTDGQGEYFTPETSVAGLTVSEGPWDAIQRSIPANNDTVTAIMDTIVMRDNLAADVSPKASKGKDSAKSVTGEVYRVWGRDESLWLDRYTISTKSWSEPVELFPGGHPALTVTDAERARKIRLTYSDTLGAMKERVSADDASTWSGEMDLGINGTHKDRLIDTDSGNEYLFYFDSGAIYMRKRSLYDSSAWSAQSPVSVVASAGDDAITAQLFPAYDSLLGKRQRILQLSYTTSGGSIASVVSTDDGSTWS